MILALVGFNSCQEDDDLEFIAAPQGEFQFTNTFLQEYILPAGNDVNTNIGVLFTWNPADFDVPTNVSYEVQYSVLGDFSDVMQVSSIGVIQDTQATISIAGLKSLAEEAGLDNDPDTTEPDTGDLSFRIRGFVGDASSTTESYSAVQTITLKLLEAPTTGGSGAFEIASWGVVGSGYNNWGGFADGKFYTTDTPGVIVSYVNLIDGEIKFRENNAWGGDLGDANLDGILDADADNNIAVTAGDYKITIDTNDMSYTIEEFSWGIVGSGFNDWGNAGPDAKLYYDYTTDTFKASVALLDGDIKFRMNNTWGGDLGDANLDGILDADADNNIAVTAGHYLVTVDLKNNSYSIEVADVWGVVGSGYNDWGNAGPDAHLTEIQPGVWFAENITLLDGEIKFRQNDTWGGDYGDANADNILDQDADNNIASEAGNYVISIDFNDPSGPVYYLGKR